MSDYVIFSDSTTDLPPALIEELGIKVLPLTFLIDNKSYKNYPDNRDLPIEDFYTKIRAGIPSKTVQISPTDFEEAFEAVLKEGKDVLYIAFSSGLSGTYQSSEIAAKDLKDKYPNNKIIVVDSLAASMGEGLLVYFAVQQKQNGLTIDELEKWLYANRNHLAHWFTVDDLHHLKRGGRVSAAAAVFGSALNIKPLLHVDNEGHLIPVKKVRGRKQSLDGLAEKLFETVLPDCKTFFISHGDSLADAKFVEKLIKTKIPDSKVYISHIGPVIGSHSGPGTIALFFLATAK
ncbi:hypothetical protein AGMMS50284_5040 [Clostridia bacterium]|nr:hypothetical protein AGMMS50284_5040 [Clostridia bacterium]